MNFNPKHKIKICTINIRGLASNRYELQQFLYEYSPDIVCVQETKTNKKIRLNGYSYATLQQGLAILVTDRIKYNMSTVHNHDVSITCQAIQVPIIGRHALKIVNTYQDCSKDIDLTHFKLIKNDPNIIYVGDFNARMSNPLHNDHHKKETQKSSRKT